MRSTTSYDTKLNPHEPSLSSCAWLCHQSALLSGAFFYHPSCDVMHRRHGDVCDVLRGCSDATTSCMRMTKQANTLAAFAKMRGGVFSKT